ncbi:MAG: DnaJ domain-containing protein [Faecalibacterium sp.]
MKDPYQTLGISRGASDDEVKKAYRAQCKRWHPDLNPNDPTAEEKFKNIQAAYDAITKGETSTPQSGYGGSPYGQGAYRQQSYGQSSYSSDPFGFGFGGFGGNYGGYGGQTQANSASYSSSDSPELQAARNYFANGQYAQARRVLDGIQRRSARWYYLSALTYNGLGQSVNALQDARMAVQMEPNNNDYRTLLSQLQNTGQTYYRRSASYGGGMGSSWCLRLILLNLLCQCCSGGGGGACYYPMMFCR